MVIANNATVNQSSYAGKELPPIEGLQIRALDDPRVVERVRVLDQYCLAVKYSDSYYDTYVRPCTHQYNQVAFYYDMLVGSCTCRLESTSKENEYSLYVMTIAVLAPYRRLGIGSRLLDTILRNVANETKFCIREVTLHVQVGSAAMKFYESFGFEVVEKVPNYYADLDECDALKLCKVVPQLHPGLRQLQRAKSGGVKNGKKK
ncbi:acetyltransferase [Trypanosoma conorhini]|uniref:Acetyltransferase n=1 Tax=Trypanosoma conorhini TaxID=83891 RepID=A0A422PVY3_9TRYP|nr:acetyltransferase [Trypanosoma conorhini]RNF21911.1 acetyltransferase [Trypanosoma conorhini]